MQLTIIGTGFVGVVSAAVYASLGNQVVGLDIDEKKIASLQEGKVPFYEPGLEELLLSQQQAGHLTFTTSYKEAITKAEIVIIAVGTPSAPDGLADLKYVYASAQAMAPYLQDQAIVVIKSTVPPGTLEEALRLIRQQTKQKIYGASMPEFLREGSAVQDTQKPDRIVIGANDDFVFERLEQLNQAFEAPTVKCSVASAQMAKYAANAYLATRITFVNEIANLCEKNGADINEVVKAIGYDKRIGQHYWYPGLGYGGSCFPKDVKELAAYSRSIGESGNLLNKVNDINRDRIPRLMQHFAGKVAGFQDKTVAVLGLSFKPNTDDMREAPSLTVIPWLLQQGAEVKSYDPMANYAKFTGQIEESHQQAESIEAACAEATVIMLLVEWPEIIGFDYAKVRNKQAQFIIDCRNQLDRDKVKSWGYQYQGIGRS